MLGICSNKSGGAENKHLVLLHRESIQAVLGLFPGTTQSVTLSTASLFQLGCPVVGAPPSGWVGTNWQQKAQHWPHQPQPGKILTEKTTWL